MTLGRLIGWSQVRVLAGPIVLEAAQPPVSRRARRRPSVRISHCRFRPVRAVRYEPSETIATNCEVMLRPQTRSRRLAAGCSVFCCMLQPYVGGLSPRSWWSIALRERREALCNVVSKGLSRQRGTPFFDALDGSDSNAPTTPSTSSSPERRHLAASRRAVEDH
jgi:hypothetical protein